MPPYPAQNALKKGNDFLSRVIQQLSHCEMAKDPSQYFTQKQVGAQPSLLPFQRKINCESGTEQAVSDILQCNTPALFWQDQAQKTEAIIKQAQSRSQQQRKEKGLALMRDGNFHRLSEQFGEEAALVTEALLLITEAVQLPFHR